MRTLAFMTVLVFLSAGAIAQETNSIDPHAEQVLRGACQYLAEAPFFMLNAEIWREHLNREGQKLQFSRIMEMEVRRPNRLHAEIVSPHSQRGFWYDGKSFSVLDRKNNVFSTTGMPDTLDEALDAAHDQFGIDLPMIDLAVSDPFKSAMARVQTARYFGLAPALGFTCHHLAFTQDNIDWQVWIQEGPQPLIRKFVITHKTEEGAPQFTALIRDWNFTSRIADSTFVFYPPAGTTRIEMRDDSVEPGEAVAPKPTGTIEPRK
jgi:hypothetical protein